MAVTVKGLLPERALEPLWCQDVIGSWEKEEEEEEEMESKEDEVEKERSIWGGDIEGGGGSFEEEMEEDTGQAARG